MDNHASTVKKYHVRWNPTYIYVVDGKEVRRSGGIKSVDALKQMYRKPWF